MNIWSEKTSGSVMKAKYKVTSVIAASLFVAACSQVPDWANPVEIYEDVTGQNDGMETSAEVEGDLENSEFPNLADTPARRAPTTQAERMEIAEGLAADRAKAEYTDEVLIGGRAAAAPPPPPLERTVEDAAEMAEASVEPEAPAAVVEEAAPVVAEAAATAVEEEVEPVAVPVARATEATMAGADESGAIGRVNWGSKKEPMPERLSAEARSKAELAEVRIVDEEPVEKVEAVEPTPVAAKAAPQPASKPMISPQKPAEPVAEPKTAQRTMPKTVAPVTTPGTASVDEASVNDIYTRMLMQSSATRVEGAVNQGFNSPSAMQFPPEVAALVPATVAETLNSPVSAPSLNLGYQVDPSSSVTIDPTVLGESAANQTATILFNNGSSYLSSEDRRTLREVASILKERGGYLRVVGHASSRTRNMQVVDHLALNRAISEKRAKAVARELVRLGVAEELILVEARGDAEPIYFEAMPAGEAGNRRVEIFHEV